MNCLKGLIAIAMELVIPETSYLNVLGMFEQQFLPICRLHTVVEKILVWTHRR